MQNSEPLNMSQRAVVGSEQRALQIRASNKAARRFSRAFRTAFREQILPKDPFFLPEQAPLYVSARSFADWTDDDQGQVAEEAGSGDFETMLDDQFWNPDGAGLLFIEGQVGCGKSTFLKYYLRCHCPNLGINKELFDKKLFINIDFRSTRTEEDFDKLFNGSSGFRVGGTAAEGRQGVTGGRIPDRSSAVEGSPRNAGTFLPLSGLV